MTVWSATRKLLDRSIRAVTLLCTFLFALQTLHSYIHTCSEPSVCHQLLLKMERAFSYSSALTWITITADQRKFLKDTVHPAPSTGAPAIGFEAAAYSPATTVCCSIYFRIRSRELDAINSSCCKPWRRTALLKQPQNNMRNRRNVFEYRWRHHFLFTMDLLLWARTRVTAWPRQLPSRSRRLKRALWRIFFFKWQILLIRTFF